jgi:hypothetical protein
VTDAATTADPLATPGVVHTTREDRGADPAPLADPPGGTGSVEYDPEAKRIVGLKAVTATEWFFQGHFPACP